MRRSHGLGVIPGHEVVDPGLFVAARYRAEGCGQPGVGIDGVELAGFDQRGQDRPILRPGIVTCEEGVLPVEGYGADGAFEKLLSISLGKSARNCVSHDKH